MRLSLWRHQWGLSLKDSMGVLFFSRNLFFLTGCSGAVHTSRYDRLHGGHSPHQLFDRLVLIHGRLGWPVQGIPQTHVSLGFKTVETKLRSLGLFSSRKLFFKLSALFQDIIMIVQRLTVAMVVEERLIRVAGSFYRKIQMRSFIYQDGRFYLTRCLVGRQRCRLQNKGAENQQNEGRRWFVVKWKQMNHLSIGQAVSERFFFLLTREINCIRSHIQFEADENITCRCSQKGQVRRSSTTVWLFSQDSCNLELRQTSE